MNGCNRAPGQGKVFEIVLGMGLCPFLSVEKGRLGAMILSARSVMILSARGIFFMRMHASKQPVLLAACWTSRKLAVHTQIVAGLTIDEHGQDKTLRFILHPCARPPLGTPRGLSFLH